MLNLVQLNRDLIDVGETRPNSRPATARGKLSAEAGHHSFFRAVRSWSLRLSAFDGLGSGMEPDAMLTLSSAL